MPNPDHVSMIRDSNDEWPSDASAGTFDIDLGGVQDYPKSNAHIQFVCPNGHRCGVFLGPEHVDRPSPNDLCIWKWNGNQERPSIWPSINCIAEKDGKPTGGCGWHGWIIDGVMK